MSESLWYVYRQQLHLEQIRFILPGLFFTVSCLDYHIPLGANWLLLLDVMIVVVVVVVVSQALLVVVIVPAYTTVTATNLVMVFTLCLHLSSVVHVYVDRHIVLDVSVDEDVDVVDVDPHVAGILGAAGQLIYSLRSSHRGGGLNVCRGDNLLASVLPW